MLKGLVKTISQVVILTLVLSACSPEAKNNSVLEVRDDGDVHYEGTDENGTFNEHKVFKDPLAETYEKGIATVKTVASKKTIMENGPTQNRVDIVIVGDGYTKAELGQYEVDAAKIADQFLNEEPLKSYKSYFNVHRIDVISSQSGITNDPKKGAKRSTALGMNYWCSGVERLLCANVQSVKQYAANAPAVDQILAIANSEKHGGAGYWSDSVGTLAARNINSIETAIHEFGHIFAKLGDEYEYAGSNSTECLSKANGSTIDALRMIQDKKKWYQWLDLSHINTFKGTCYSSSGYRPTMNSKMRTLGLPFYEVNSEQMILALYSKVKPIDSATAPGTYPKNRILRVTPIQPIGRNLDIRWYHNGKEIASAAQKTSFSVASLGIKSGKFTVSVKVSDLTPQVRDEAQRKKLMTETRSWTIQ